MKCIYSGSISRKLWERIRKCDNEDGQLYELGCLLQNLEYRFIQTLTKFEKRRRKKKHGNKNKTSN